MAFKAISQPQRTNLTSDFNSATTIIYVPVPYLSQQLIHRQMIFLQGGQMSPIELRGYAAAKSDILLKSVSYVRKALARHDVWLLIFSRPLSCLVISYPDGAGQRDELLPSAKVAREKGQSKKQISYFLYQTLGLK